MGGQVYETLTDQLLAQGREEGREEGIEKGKLDILVALVRDGLLPVEEAAKRGDMTVEDMHKLVANKN